MPKGTFKPYLLYEMFTHEKAGFPQTNEESPPFFVYRIKSRFSVKRRNPNPSPTRKIKFGFLSFGPSAEIRTQGLLNPIQARYQTSPHPDLHLCPPECVTQAAHIDYHRLQKKASPFLKFFKFFCFPSGAPILRPRRGRISRYARTASRASARSVFSQGRSRSSRPKWP